VAAAARIYQGIHDEVRANGYDNLTRRAYTTLPRKLRLGLGGLIDLKRLGAMDGAHQTGGRSTATSPLVGPANALRRVARGPSAVVGS